MTDVSEQSVAGLSGEEMSDARAILANLDFEECEACAGIGYPDGIYECSACKGHGTIPVWSDPA